jgi:defect-in-organelle-trafficking protein DotC
MPSSTVKIAVLLTALLLTSCLSGRRVPVNDTGSLASIQAMSAPKNLRAKKHRKMGKIREMALREIALSLGAQAGLSWRARLIDEDLNRQTRHLDTIYDFNSLVLEHNILPPVLLEGRNTLNLADAQTIRVSDRTYKVAKQARFITTPPNWRQYLWMDYTKPEMPNITLLPKTKEEKEVWCLYTERGWKNGIEKILAG